MIAVVDEAMHGRGPGFYVLGAVAIDEQRRAPVRTAAIRIIPGRRRFHWHSEADPERRAMLTLAGTEGAYAIALLGSPAPNRRHEQIRQQLLARLREELLQRRGRLELVIESRQEQNDRKDRRTLIGVSHAAGRPAGFSYAHVSALDEPLLWLADAVAGATRAIELRAHPAWFECLPPKFVSLARVPCP